MAHASPRPAHEQTALLRFFVLAFLISWIVAFPLVADRFGWWGIDAPGWLHYLVPLGPFLAAAIVLSIAAGISR